MSREEIKQLSKDSIIEKATKAWYKNIVKSVLCWLVYSILIYIAGYLFQQVVFPNACNPEIGGPIVLFRRMIPICCSAVLAVYFGAVIYSDYLSKQRWVEKKIKDLKFHFMIHYAEGL